MEDTLEDIEEGIDKDIEVGIDKDIVVDIEVDIESIVDFVDIDCMMVE
jgi:hypothetical protein